MPVGSCFLLHKGSQRPLGSFVIFLPEKHPYQCTCQMELGRDLCGLLLR